LSQSGVDIADFRLDRPSLDDVFLALTGHGTEDPTSSPEVAS
jgi:ABC-2 type transport system ATP-binding protein